MRLILMTVVFALTACAPSHEGATVKPGTPTVKPDAPIVPEGPTREQQILKQERITFADVQEVVLSKCTGCHREGGRLDDLTTLEAIQAGKSLIKPGDPDNSNIYFQISFGLMPPPKKPQVTADGLSVLKRWIEEGALAE